MKYWRLKLKGELSHDHVQEALKGKGADILRIDTDTGETRVYYTRSEEHRLQSPAAVSSGDEAEEVSIDEVTRTRSRPDSL